MKEGDGLSPEPQQYKQTKEQRENNMKIRNLAFCGVMASILGVSGAYAADATIIASKAYVDARDNTKQDTANIVTGTWANSTADHNSTTKYPSMNTLGSAIQAGATDAINALNLSTDGQTGVIKTVKQTNGLVAVTSGTVNTNDITDSAVTNGKIASGAVTEGKIASGAVTLSKINDSAKELNNAIVSANGDNLVTVKGIQAGVAKQGEFDKAWNEAFEESAATGAGATNLYAAKGAMDEYVPTVAAVEKRITSAVGAGTSGLNGRDADSAEGLSEGVANEENKGMAVVKVSETAGIVTAKLGAIGTAGLQDNAVTTDKIADSTITNSDISTTAAITTNKMGAITGYTISTETGAARNLAATDTLNVALGKLEKKADDNATTVSNLDLTADQNTGSGQAVVQVTQTDGQVAAARGILDYNKAMNAKLSEINTNGDDGSQGCTKRSPCTLTMVMDNGNPVYEWTNMETDGLDGVL